MIISHCLVSCGHTQCVYQRYSSQLTPLLSIFPKKGGGVNWRRVNWKRGKSQPPKRRELIGRGINWDEYHWCFNILASAGNPWHVREYDFLGLWSGIWTTLERRKNIHSQKEYVPMTSNNYSQEYFVFLSQMCIFSPKCAFFLPNMCIFCSQSLMSLCCFVFQLCSVSDDDRATKKNSFL